MIQDFDLNAYIYKREIICPVCGDRIVVDLRNYQIWEGYNDRLMDREHVIQFDSNNLLNCPECGCKLHLTGYISEYPAGAIDQDEIKIECKSWVRVDKQGFPVCDVCGSSMTVFDGCWWYKCPECGNKIRSLDDGEWRWERETYGSGSGKCFNCGRSLSGGAYTAPWENGNNPDGYIICPHCHAVNFK